MEAPQDIDQYLCTCVLLQACCSAIWPLLLLNRLVLGWGYFALPSKYTLWFELLQFARNMPSPARKSVRSLRMIRKLDQILFKPRLSLRIETRAQSWRALIRICTTWQHMVHYGTLWYLSQVTYVFMRNCQVDIPENENSFSQSRQQTTAIVQWYERVQS